MSFLPVTLFVSTPKISKLWNFFVTATIFEVVFCVILGVFRQLTTAILPQNATFPTFINKKLPFYVKSLFFIWSVQKKALPLHRSNQNINRQSIICCLNRRLFYWLVSNNRYIPNTPCDGYNGLANPIDMVRTAGSIRFFYLMF